MFLHKHQRRYLYKGGTTFIKNENRKEKETMVRTTQLEGNELRERFKKLSKPLNESVSMVEPTKYHNRVSPTSRKLQTFNKQNDSIQDLGDDDEIDLQELIDELEDENVFTICGPFPSLIFQPKGFLILYSSPFDLG